MIGKWPTVSVILLLACPPALAGQRSRVEWREVETRELEPHGDAQSVKYQLERIVIKGNRKTMDQVILRYVTLTPGQFFSVDDERIDACRYRLMALGLFSSVSVELRKGSSRGHVELVVTVVERNTIVLRDLSFGLTRIAPNWGTVVPFGSVAVEEGSFLGTGIALGGQVAGSKDQVAYRLYLSDNHFLNTKFGLHAEGTYAQSQEYFGDRFLPAPDETDAFGRYEKLDYRRAGIRLGTGYNLLVDYFFWFDWRFENILAEEPQTVEATDPSMDQPVTIGYLEPDSSVLSSIMFGFRRDTTNHPVLPYDGSVSKLSVELSNPVIGSSYNFAKFVFSHKTHFPFGKAGQCVTLGGTAGLITGNAPFFEQFFVGDYSSLVPDRKLGLNFSNLHPSVLDTSIADMWYEDLVLALDVEYNYPFYRGSGVIYGINGFIRFGVFAMTSAQYIDDSGVPMDITGDFGVRIDTRVGVFSLSFANVLQLIPPIRKETTQ